MSLPLSSFSRNRVSVACPACGGMLPIGKHKALEPCRRCNGRGWIMVDQSEYGAVVPKTGSAQEANP